MSNRVCDEIVCLHRADKFNLFFNLVVSCTMEIKTNNQPRPVMYWYELPTNIQTQEFDWVDQSIQDDMTFVHYKGDYLCLDEYMRISKDAPAQWREGGWQGYNSDSFFSGTLIKYTDDHESVIVATYLS